MRLQVLDDLCIPRDSLRQKFLPQIKKKAPFWICGISSRFAVFFRIAAELVFSVFYPLVCGGNRRECGGNRRECGGNSRKANSVAAFLFWLRRFFGLRLIFWREPPPQCVAAEISAAGSSRYACSSLSCVTKSPRSAAAK